MPLSPPEPRTPLHDRRITCTGYRRADGLWDVEGHLIDVKTYPIANESRAEIAPGEPLHDMWLRLTVNDELRIVAAEAAIDSAPHTVCGAIAPAFAELAGIRIRPGWQREIARRLGGVRGCTHLVELLGPLATVCYQTVYGARRAAGGERPQGKPRQIGKCHAYRQDGPLVRRRWPEYATPED